MGDGGLYIQHVGGWVRVSVKNLRCSSQGGTQLFTLPVGWRWDTQTTDLNAAFGISGAGAVVGSLATWGGVNIVANQHVTGVAWSASLSTPSRDPFPSGWLGTPIN